MMNRSTILLVPGLPSDPGADAGVGVDREVLISRVVEGRAEASDWMRLRALAGSDLDIWNDLALSQAQASALSRELEGALARVQDVALPAVGADRTERLGVLHLGGERWGGERAVAVAGHRVRTALPWALAACLGLALFTQMNLPARVTPVPGAGGVATMGTSGASLGPSVMTPGYSSPDDALAEYLRLGKEQGQVVAELPQRVVVESRPAPGGAGYEVLYLRQVLERAVVSDLYRTGVDDAGRRVLLPASVPGAGGGPL